MSTKIILGLVVILLVVVGGLFFFNSSANDSKEGAIMEEKTSSPASEPKEETATEYTVTYSNKGFSPEALAVPSGASVMFKNESETSLWVASAIHPTHSLYPQKSSDDCLGSSFDACAVTSPGSSWSFTFTEVGSWNYHNHIQANHRGTIIVK